MSITLDTNVYLIKDRLNIDLKRLNDYGNKSVDEIVEAEAAQGNTQAVSYAKDLFNDTSTLIQAFKLGDYRNKYRILRRMTTDQLEQLLPLLEKEDLVAALNFFTKEKLLKLLDDIPKDQLVNVALEMYSMKDIMKLMPDDQLDKFLTNTDLDKDLLRKHMEKLPPEILAQMYEAATGQLAEDLDPRSLTQQITTLNPTQYKQAIESMDPQVQRQLIMKITSEDPKTLQLFENSAYINMISFKEKPEIIKAMEAIDQEELLKMMQQLPQDLLAVVVTQIDTESFADALINKFPQILEEIVAG